MHTLIFFSACMSKGNSWKILSVGGSIIIPKTGFDISFLQAFHRLIVEQIQKGERLILSIGGGATCRQYQQAASAVVTRSNIDLDWLGIHTTYLNAEFVRYVFQEYAYPKIIHDPTKKVQTTKKLLISAGWKPGFSTDNVAVTLAKTYGAKEVINLSNIEYVYDKDPSIYSDAKKIESIQWATFRKNIVGNVWQPGLNLPFDPVASRSAERLGLTVKILRGTDLGEVKTAVMGQKFVGTIIQP